MAIKHGSISISAVKHGSITVSQVDHGSINVFYLYYAVTVSAGNGVLRVFLSTNQNALSGSPSGTKFLKGTTVYAFAALDTAGYKAPSKWSYIGNGNIYRVGSATVNSAYNFGTINAETASGPCTVEYFSNLIGLQRAYLSTSPEATFGSSSLSVSPGNTVYGFAVLGSDVYTVKSGWTLISGTACKQGAIYRVGSKTPTSAGTTTRLTINLFESHLRDVTVLFTRSGNSEGSWTVKHNELMVSKSTNWAKFYKSGTSIYCSYVDYNDQSFDGIIGTFNCPTGYTVNFTLTDKDGQIVTWNNPDDPVNGPYVIDAETTADSSQT